jgi:AcrR family transcriptional regulator
MGSTPRRARFKAEVRTQILSAARDIFVHDGYASFSMRGLAERLGYSPGAVYKHFKSKREIFDCLANTSFQALMESSSGVKSIEGEDPIDRLKRGMWAYVNFGLKNPEHYRFAFLIPQPDDSQPYKPRASYEGLQERVRLCVEAGRFDAGNLGLMSQSLWAAAHGITSLLIQKPKFGWANRRKLIAQVIDSAVDGLRVQTD